MLKKVCGQIVGEFCGSPKTYLKLFQFSYLMPFLLWVFYIFYIETFIKAFVAAFTSDESFGIFIKYLFKYMLLTFFNSLKHEQRFGD